MVSARSLVLLAAGLLVVGCSNDVTNNDPPPPTDTWGEVDPALAAKFQTALENARAEQGLPGLAMAVAYRDTRELWVSATGLADVSQQREWLATDESRIGSVTKTHTAAIVMRLVQDGVLSLDDPIEKWVPGWYTGPTLAQLLAHTSGIVSYNYIGNFDDSASWEPEALVEWAYQHEPTLRFTPGSDWEYSNTNYALLGLVIEAASGVSYAEALDQWLFEPLNLKDSRLALSGDSSPTLVHCYEGSPPVDTFDVTDPSFGWAAGAIASTPSDLARWTVALYGGELLEADTLSLMTTSSGVTGPGEEDYGLGTIIQDGDGIDNEFTLYGHTGGIGGYVTSAFYMKERNVAVIIMSNHHGTDVNDASMHGWAAVLGLDYP